MGKLTLRRRLTVGLTATLVAGGGALVGTPLRAATSTFTMTLTTSATTANAGTDVTLTATVSPTPTTGYHILIDEVTTGAGNECVDSNPCSLPFSYPTAGTHTFHAELFDGPPTADATSNPVTVPWIGTATYSLTLSASDTRPTSGQTVAVTGTASPNVPTGYRLDIWETQATTTFGAQPAPPTWCYETSPCTMSATHVSGEYTYQAFIDDDPTIEDPPAPGTELAVANPVTVDWVTPSQTYCNPATLPIIDGTVAGLQTVLAVTSGGSQTAVCFRVADGTAVGGVILVSASVAPVLPSVVPGNLCRGAQGNTLQAPVGPPVIDVTVLGEPLYLGAYNGPASNGTLEVCASVAGVADTIVFNIGIGPQPSVQFIPDPDSIIQSL